jgi:hypothetical protein
MPPLKTEASTEQAQGVFVHQAAKRYGSSLPATIVMQQRASLYVTRKLNSGRFTTDN